MDPGEFQTWTDRDRASSKGSLEGIAPPVPEDNISRNIKAVAFERKRKTRKVANYLTSTFNGQMHSYRMPNHYASSGNENERNAHRNMSISIALKVTWKADLWLPYHEVPGE